MYHHYKGTQLPRSDAIQKLVVERILINPLTDDQRENSKVWELKHSSSCIQIGRLLAIKRGLNVELAEIICALHDVYAIDTGHYVEHAQRGAETAKELLHTTSQFSDQEIKVICDAIQAHSDKHLYSDDPYSELIKDADIFDCSLYEGTKEYYEKHKPIEVLKQYYHRIQKVREELGLPPDTQFTVK
ncbi:MAG: HD domain-containing protein [Patescibacteria group bacterium]